MKGVSLDRDVRFDDKEKKIIKGMKFPEDFNTKVDMKKVKLDVIKPWISRKITELLGFEDEVFIGYIFGLLEQEQFPDPRILQVKITGFLATDSSYFMESLWKLLISAQNSVGGIPEEFMKRKINEIQARKAERDRITAGLAKKMESTAQGAILEAEREQQQTTSNGQNKVRDTSPRRRKRSPSPDEDRRREKRHRHHRHRSYSRSRSPRRSRSRSPRRSRSRDDRHRDRRHRDSSRERERDRDRDRRHRDSSRERERERDRRRRSSRSPDKRTSVSDAPSNDNSYSGSNPDQAENLEQELRKKALASLSKQES